MYVFQCKLLKLFSFRLTMLPAILSADRRNSTASSYNKLVAIADAVVSFGLHQAHHPKVEPIEDLNKCNFPNYKNRNNLT